MTTKPTHFSGAAADKSMTDSYRGNLFALPDSVLRQPAFLQELASFYRNLELSGAMACDLVEDEIYAYHCGDLFSVKDEWLDPDRLRPSQLWQKHLLRTSVPLDRMRRRLWDARPWEDITFEMGDLFGNDRRGMMNKFMGYAIHPPKNALAAYLAPRIMFFDFARRIHTQRLSSSLS